MRAVIPAELGQACALIVTFDTVRSGAATGSTPSIGVAVRLLLNVSQLLAAICGI